MYLTEVHIGIPVRRIYWIDHQVKYFIPTSFSEIGQLIKYSVVTGITYYSNGRVFESDIWCNTDNWEFYHSPTTDFILED